MLTHDQIRDELIRQAAAGDIVQSDVAKKLGIAPARVSEMIKGTRKVQPKEMPALAELLGMIPPQPQNGRAVTSTAKIKNLGKVAQGVWLEQTMEPDPHDYVPYDRMAGDPGTEDLFAVTPEGLSMNLEFTPGAMLICRRVPYGFQSIKSGDFVVVERANHELREMTCKQLVLDDEGVAWLHSKSDQPQFQQPIRVGRPDDDLHVDNEIHVIGKVIRAVKSYEDQ